ncbi:MAG: DNA methyltransferase [Phormidesmis sp.]
MSSHQATRRLIESETFPFEFLSLVAKRESWRKEIYRPVYHVHKWWAKRLGSIFRGLLLGAILPENSSLEEEFYKTHSYSSIVVFDPFLGSGTTVGEAHKLGMTALGRDINPVACEAVRVALSPLSIDRLSDAYDAVTASVENKIRELYQGSDDSDEPFETLYYFWVKQVSCPECNSKVSLFKSYVFARNAYPKKKPKVQVVCPSCSSIFDSVYSARQVTCTTCLHRFDQSKGPVQGSKATCQKGHTFSISKALRTENSPPRHRLYAQLVLRSDGQKQYLAATDADHETYAASERRLREEIAAGRLSIPRGKLEDGHNTRQAIGYNYTRWHHFFNARQTLALSWLHDTVAALSSAPERDALLILFSGTLEFNNLFASYKGEGTGAVRHMFSHHVLKPEMTPIEANVWGTSKSSGSFSGLYKSRLLRALAYRRDPFEVGTNGQKKVYGAAIPMARNPLDQWGDLSPGGISISCGDSADTGLPASSVDLVVTDPPFFDNVHYSELADFFYAWQVLHPRGFVVSEETTRKKAEVQDTNAERFARKLQAVLSECNRILKSDGLLVFSYHHSRADGWEALAQSIWGSGFYVAQTHPVYAELSASTPKAKTSDPVLVDAIIVCRKGSGEVSSTFNPDKAVNEAVSTASWQLARLIAAGHKPTGGDKFVTVTSQFMARLGAGLSGADASALVQAYQAELRSRIENIDL